MIGGLITLGLIGYMIVSTGKEHGSNSDAREKARNEPNNHGFYIDNRGRMRTISTNEICDMGLKNGAFKLYGLETKRTYRDFNFEALRHVNSELKKKNAPYEYTAVKFRSSQFDNDSTTRYLRKRLDNGKLFTIKHIRYASLSPTYNRRNPKLYEMQYVTIDNDGHAREIFGEYCPKLTIKEADDWGGWGCDVFNEESFVHNFHPEFVKKGE